MLSFRMLSAAFAFLWKLRTVLLYIEYFKAENYE